MRSYKNSFIKWFYFAISKWLVLMFEYTVVCVISIVVKLLL